MILDIRPHIFYPISPYRAEILTWLVHAVAETIVREIQHQEINLSYLCRYSNVVLSLWIPTVTPLQLRLQDLDRFSTMDQAQKHRDACDACHYRKIRCPFTGPGACTNCQRFGRVCAFSPRDEMGRPKRSTAKKGREGPRKKSTAKSSPPEKHDDLDQPLQSTEDKTMPDAFANEESTMLVETVDMSFPGEWQNLLSFPADEEDFTLYA